MKDIRTQILGEGSVNACSNVLHGRVKIRFYFSVSIKPLGEIQISFPIYTRQKLFTRGAGRGGAGQGWAAGPAPRQVLALAETVRANTEGLFRIRLLAVRISCIGG